MDIVLTAVEARVLGSLLEKEVTVPATYPLTMKALIAACNQSTSRDPLMDLSEADVAEAIDALKAHKLVRKVLPSHGDRSVKYRQVAVEALTVDEAQRAILTVLLLRGPQTPQELKTRTDRLHPFADPEAVEATLADMAGWGDPLVRLLPRRPGQRDARWAHLLSGEPDLSAPEPAPRATRAPAAPAAPPAPQPEAVHGPLAALAGTWSGPDGGRVEVVPRPGQPVLAWQARGAGDEEVGFLRLVGDDEVELALATASGRAEAWRGLVEVAAGARAVELVLSGPAGDRTYRVDATTLTTDTTTLTRVT
ncbi:MAG TPA: DUF480 domain-containing protein [Iamia sp.]|nr:DUF480 domain-containing protein [Iamia sp.]